MAEINGRTFSELEGRSIETQTDAQREKIKNSFKRCGVK